MRGQIEEQRGDAAAAREFYNKGVSLDKHFRGVYFTDSYKELTCSYINHTTLPNTAQEESQLYSTVVASLSP